MIYLHFTSKFHISKSCDKSPDSSIHSFKSSISCFQHKAYSFQTTFNVKQIDFQYLNVHLSSICWLYFQPQLAIVYLKNIDAKSRTF